MQSRVDTVLEHLGLDADAPFASASGGRKRQTLLARALVRQPDILLLDEPTNHLDVDAVEWMEQFLIDRGVTLVFVTHDRAFLRRVATRIVELDRGRLVDWGTDYDTYLSARKQRSTWKRRSGQSSTESSRRKKCGFGRGFRRVAHATKDAYAHSKRCASNAVLGESAPGQSGSRRRRLSGQVGSSSRRRT
jgi:ATPase subunit of ABC transporter with duplicated ATPase domains